MPYVIAHALLYGAVRLDAFSEERLVDPAIRKLMKKITLRADAELSAVFPKKRPARVTIGTYDGREFQHFQPYRKGDREEPLSDADLNNKFDELVAPVIGLEAARSLRDKLWQIDELPVRQLKFANFRAQESKRHQQ